MIKMLKGYLKYVLIRLLPYQRIGKNLDGDYLSADMDFIRHGGEGSSRFSPYNTCLENKSDKPSKYSLIFNIPFVQFPLHQYIHFYYPLQYAGICLLIEELKLHKISYTTHFADLTIL